jgi:thymidylate synthase (FAD)
MSLDILERITEKKVDLLDQGYIRLVDCMPRLVSPNEEAMPVDSMDTAICNAARTSYGTEFCGPQDKDVHLIRRLMREYHTSPFEQCEFKFQIKAPIFVHRQLLRHRTASLNEESGRYTVIKDDMHIPDSFRRNSKHEKQATVFEGTWQPELIDGEDPLCLISEHHNASYQLYQDLLNAGIAREQARIVLPLSTYSTLVWKMDLLNLLKFCRLRSDSHAQYEIRVYSDAMLKWIEALAPLTYQAFMDYWVNSISLSPAEQTIIANFLEANNIPISTLIDSLATANPKTLGLGQTELDSFRNKLTRLA